MGAVLYITFDGITDPLGRSQILPYLTGLSKMGHTIHILSQEKENQFAREGEAVLELLKKYNIAWDHIDYTNKPPIIQPLIQRQAIKKRAVKFRKNDSKSNWFVKLIFVFFFLKMMRTFCKICKTNFEFSHENRKIKNV